MNLFGTLVDLKSRILVFSDSTQRLDMLLILLDIQYIQEYLNDEQKDEVCEMLMGIEELNTVNFSKIKDKFHLKVRGQVFCTKTPRS
jgi:hypothetical protein